MNRRDEILEKTGLVPALPSAATHVLQLLKDPDASMADIVKGMEMDPGLTANVLRIANSAYFAGPRKVGTLREAGVLFGTARIEQMILAGAISPLTGMPIKGYDLAPGRLLDNLVAAAVAVDEIPRVLSIAPHPMGFTGGLLHGVGKIVLGTFVEVDVSPILAFAEDEGVPFDEAERRVLGIDHAEVGAALLDHWKFPSELVEAVRWQYRPEEVEENTLLVDLIHVGGNLSAGCGFGSGIDGLRYRVSPAVVARMKLSTKLLERVVCKMLAEMAGIKSTLVERGEGN